MGICAVRDLVFIGGGSESVCRVILWWWSGDMGG